MNVLALVLSLSAGALAAVLTAGSGARRVLGALVALGGCAAPMLVEPTMVRGLFGLLQLNIVFRVIDLTRERRALSPARRVGHVFSLVDSRLLKPAPPALDARAVQLFLLWAAVAVAGLALAWPSTNLLLRWLGGLVMAYAFVEALWVGARGFYAALGFATPGLHSLPVVSRSVQELWGERWAIPVRRWLHAHFFLPLARRGWPRGGVALAFLGSAVVHAWVVLICVGAAMAGLMLAYFMVQALLVVVERAIGVSRWRPALARTWVIAVMVSSSPLFTEPFLRCLGL